MSGHVALVGAGPGDPGLMTVRGLALLRGADVVIYDRLVDPRLLDEAPPRALRIFAGKISGAHPVPQAEINALLVSYARRGRRVVRLKGGDPFVFGRGGEEAQALAAAGVAFEVVPGVSSAVAVPAYAGIPVTHRGTASSFAVVTGHEVEGKAETSVDWARLATAVDTLVILMGARSLPAITRALLEAGRPADTPVAVIRWGTTDAQQTIVGRLDEIASVAPAIRLAPPVVIVVGDVVALRGRLAWFAEEVGVGARHERGERDVQLGQEPCAGALRRALTRRARPRSPPRTRETSRARPPCRGGPARPATARSHGASPPAPARRARSRVAPAMPERRRSRPGECGLASPWRRRAARRI